MSRDVQQTQPIGTLVTNDRREALLLILAGCFVLVGAVGLHLAYAPFTAGHLAFVLLSFLLSFGTAHLVLRRLPGRDPLLLPAAALLSGWGLLVIGRTAPGFLSRQATWLMLSVLAMLTVTEIGKDLGWLQRYRYTWLVAGLVLLAATLILGVNPVGSGPRRWLKVGEGYFQPSEPLKLLMVVYLASYLADRRRLLVSEGRKIGLLRLPPLAYVGPLVLMFGVTALLLAAQQDLGAAMLFFFTFLAMLYLATGQWGYVGAGLILFVAAGVVAYTTSPRLALRIDAWVQPWPGAADWAFQIVQSLLAFGAGGIVGEGLGLGFPTFIPAVHTDFTFAAIGEAFGLLGVLGVIALYGIILMRGFYAALHAGRPFERFLSAGLAAGLVIQAWVIMAANLKVAPIAGVTLPFVAYGGSSLLCSFIALGVVIRVSHRGNGSYDDRGEGVGPVPKPPENWRPILHLAGALGLGLVVLALACGYWTVVRAEWLVGRGDNPRRVIYEQRLVRGQVLDREGRTLAGVVVDSSGRVTRTYPVPEAAPVVGYASLRYGTGGIEAAFDEALRGEAGRSPVERGWAELLHRAPQGRDIQLTLDAELQRLGQADLAGETGAAVLMDGRSGEVLVMASAPTFDPSRVGEVSDEPASMLNRAAQSLYQPGGALQSVVVAEALHQGLVPDLTVEVGDDLAAEVMVGGRRIGCVASHLLEGARPTLATAYGAACPVPIGALGVELGVDGLTQAVARWGLTNGPPLMIPTEGADWRPETSASVRDEAMGQGKLVVSPLQMALAVAALSNDGTMPAPRLALRVQDRNGEWREVLSDGTARTVIGAGDAHELAAAWPEWDGVAGLWSLAVAGEGRPHAWFLGWTAGEHDERYAVAVLLERPEDPRRAVAIGCGLLEAARGKPGPGEAG